MEKTLEEYGIEYETQVTLNENILNNLGSISSKWRKSSNSYFIVSPSAKKQGSFQLTFFRNDTPIFDMLRPSFQDFAEELFLNECTIEQINHIY